MVRPPGKAAGEAQHERRRAAVRAVPRNFTASMIAMFAAATFVEGCGDPSATGGE
jgi:hypothetical protein